MRHTVAIVATEDHLREHCAALLQTTGRLDVLAGPADTIEPLFDPDATVVFCSAADYAATIADAAQRTPGSRLVAVLPSVNRHVVRRAIRAGAAAVVREEDIESALPIAVQSALAGLLSIPIDLADGLDKPVLSAREKQILGMVVMGFTNGQVARRLYLAESTVKSHMSSIFGKLGVSSRKEAAALVLDPDAGLGLGILTISAEPIPAGAHSASPTATAA